MNTKQQLNILCNNSFNKAKKIASENRFTFFDIVCLYSMFKVEVDAKRDNFVDDLIVSFTEKFKEQMTIVSVNKSFEELKDL